MEEKSPSERLYLFLYNYLKNGIINNQLPESGELPSTRSLATQLGISRSTVIRAYELLKLEGYLVSRGGSGYRVRSIQEENFEGSPSFIGNQAYPEMSKVGQSFLKNINLINRTSDKGIAFRPGLPPLDIFPVNQWKSLTNLYWRHIKSSALSYSPSSGILPLKKSIATYLNITRNIQCDYRQIMIVSGSLQSLYLIGSVLIDEGDEVILENPTFPNVHSIFRSLRAHIQAVGIGSDGIKLEEFRRNESRKLKVIHTTPSHHYPTGVRMSLKRRYELLSWANSHSAFIIENDYEHEISNWKNPIPSLFSLDKEGRVIYMGTFNRLLHPSVRLGYMVVPHYLMDAVEALQRHSHRFVPPSFQIVMNQFIEKKYLYQHVRNVIEVAEERRLLFEETFNDCFQGKIFLAPRAANSLYALARFRGKENDQQITEALESANIVAHAYSKCFIGNRAENGLILGYASVRNPVIKSTLPRMLRLWSKHRGEIGI
ncbi:MAG: PLP-dependent aminotransferase family protein [Bacteroidota bacterium]